MIRKRLYRIFAEVLHVDAREVTEDMTLSEDLDADSLDLCQIIRKTEDEFQISVPGHAFERLRTVRDVLRLIEKD